MVYELICKILTMHEEIEVRNEQGENAYEAHTKMMSMTDKSVITNGEGREIAKFHRKVFSIHQIHMIEMLGGEVMTMKEELLHPFKDVMDVEENGWKLKGNFMSHAYDIVDQDGQVLAEITRPWASVHDRCRIDVKDDGKADQLVSLAIVLEHMLIDRRQGEEAAVGAGAAAGSAANSAGSGQ